MLGWRASRVLFCYRHIRRACATVHRDVVVGDTADIVKTFSEEDVTTFARISMDSNSIHCDRDAAEAAGFSGIVVHGVLCMGLLSAAIGTKVDIRKPKRCKN